MIQKMWNKKTVGTMKNKSGSFEGRQEDEKAEDRKCLRL